MGVEDISETLSEKISELADAEIETVWVFGSIARKTATERSDVDLAVLFAPGVQRRLLGPAERLAARLERTFRRPAQVVDLERSPCDLTHRVLRDGLLLLDRNPGRRIRFEVGARNRYFDLLPVLRRYRHGATART